MNGSEILDLSFNCHWERECKREANLLNKHVLKWESISGTGVGIGGRVVSRTKSLLLSVHFLDDFKNIDEAYISESHEIQTYLLTQIRHPSWTQMMLYSFR